MELLCQRGRGEWCLASSITHVLLLSKFLFLFFPQALEGGSLVPRLTGPKVTWSNIGQTWVLHSGPGWSWIHYLNSFDTSSVRTETGLQWPNELDTQANSASVNSLPPNETVTNTVCTHEQALLGRTHYCTTILNPFKPDDVPTGPGLNTRPDMVRNKTEFAILAWLFWNGYVCVGDLREKEEDEKPWQT
jgi:hypothetical protein